MRPWCGLRDCWLNNRSRYFEVWFCSGVFEVSGPPQAPLGIVHSHLTIQCCCTHLLVGFGWPNNSYFMMSGSGHIVPWLLWSGVVWLLQGPVANQKWLYKCKVVAWRREFEFAPEYKGLYYVSPVEAYGRLQRLFVSITESSSTI